MMFTVFLRAIAVGSVLLTLARPALCQRQAAGVQVPEGFNVQLFADDEMAHDIYCLTIDVRGRVVVSGPGYVRILIDVDNDGKADDVKQFADGPRTGAQGMYFDGRNLICSGDAGLQIYRDDNRDDKADKEPEPFLRMLAGGEHHVHSIQKGPDGWYYVIAGNYTGITDNYVSLKSSPIAKPYAGVLMRLKRDFTGGEVVSDGMRNAYDFAFTRQGDVFTFDSDGERDISLPWYRPTRVFQLLPMANAGWVSRSWKRPNYFVDMAPVVTSFGRSSPTFVVPYQHDQFPKKYQDAIFVADWTYGRVMALPLKPDGSVWATQPIDFMKGVGDFGFAPTSAAVAPDGSLYVSVGGRGTRGGVYKVTFGKGADDVYSPATNDEARLGQVLDAHMPLEAWSRNRWMRMASRLKREPFAKVAVDEKQSDKHRMRAIEILTEMFDGVSDEEAAALAKSSSTAVRSRTAWAIGRQNPEAPSMAALKPFATDSNMQVRRFAMEALSCATAKAEWKTALPLLATNLKSEDRFVRQSASRAATRVPAALVNDLYAQVRDSAPGTISLGLTLADRKNTVSPNVIKMGIAVLEPAKNGSIHPVELRLECARLIQMGLGDVGPGEKRFASYEGYASRQDLTKHAKVVDDLRPRIAKVFPSKDATLDYEIARIIAMVEPTDTALLDRLLA